MPLEIMKLTKLLETCLCPIQEFTYLEDHYLIISMRIIKIGWGKFFNPIEEIQQPELYILHIIMVVQFYLREKGDSIILRFC